ncbi:hypothetical protein CAPTEDRAFT_221059 [Capitella teleta]|uniref:Uncharacterized protein n=1 Tax=Capitella teleta TaxID=283909 RepID=R7T372_CAPTE|nr:hypothetical protein CAPTEDRAFT_221059 [Capitella teleta]|eukprot:ELT87048.1 hypothetical protein CAPTEDRAFT_221059 [Capitella teleta]
MHPLRIADLDERSMSKRVIFITSMKHGRSQWGIPCPSEFASDAIEHFQGMNISATVRTCNSTLKQKNSSRCLTEGRIIRTSNIQPEQQQHFLHKRNAWWSKKSINDIHKISSANSLGSASDQLVDVEMAVACYTGSCVPEFVWCGRQAEDKTKFLACRARHGICASECFDGSNLLSDAVSSDFHV